MKPVIFLSAFLLGMQFSYSQDNKTYTVYDYLEVAQKANWVPRKDGKHLGSYKLFEKSFIETCKDYRAIPQMTLDGNYFCEKNHDFLFEQYNKFYRPVSKEYWDANCPLLYILMYLDRP